MNLKQFLPNVKNVVTDLKINESESIDSKLYNKSPLQIEFQPSFKSQSNSHSTHSTHSTNTKQMSFTKSQRRNYRRSIKKCTIRKQIYFSMMKKLVREKVEAHYYWARREGKYPKSTTFKVSESWECKCHDRWHRLSVEYFVFPMDVDLLSFFEDGERLGYTML